MVAPALDKITSFSAPKRILMGPGPSNIDPRVLAAMNMPVIGHLDPAFAGMMEELKVLLRYVFKTENALTYPVSGPGSVGMENCFVNLITPGDKVIVCRNGVFGGRMIENVERSGGIPVVVDDTWGEPVDPGKVEDAFKSNPGARILAFVQAETSTGCESDVKTLAQIAQARDAFVILDTVTALGGTPVLIDEWKIDAVFAGTQKCLSCPPGLSPVSFSERAVEFIKNRKDKVQSWFMDVNLILNYWGDTARTYHHTAPVNALYGLHEALMLLKEEGMENAWARHVRHYQALKAGLESMGLHFLVKEESRLPQMNVIVVPEGIDEAAVRRELLNEFLLEIGAGLGTMAGKAWRIGLMGYSAKKENVMHCLSSLGTVLARMGHPVTAGKAEAEADRVYASHG